MTIRFLQLTPSSNPDFPFQPGQIIRVEPNETWLALLDGVRAELVREDDDVELATVAAPERAVTRRPRKSER